MLLDLLGRFLPGLADDLKRFEHLWYVFTPDFRDDIHALRKGSKDLMADVDILNAAVAALQGDETAEETLGAQIFAAIQTLQAAGAPNLAPAIAALQALHAKIGTELQAGSAFAQTLPGGTTTPTTPPATS